MLDLIYIIEDRVGAATAEPANGDYRPNFTMPGRDASKIELTQPNAGKSAVAAAAGAAILAITPFSLPIALVTTAVGAAPSIISMFRNGQDEEPEQIDAAQAELAVYVSKHSLTKEHAKQRGYRFQPGHPVVGKAYRRHPLSDLNAESGNLYIPSDSYDSILLEERESELLKLLVELGATKITITKKTATTQRNAVHAGIEVQAGPVGGGGISGTSSSQRDVNALDTREFSLTGKPWDTSSHLDKERFYWLAYEPSWKAVVFAREQGGCLTASLEIKETTSFSADKSIEMTVKAKLAEVSGNAGVSNSSNDEKVYLVRADFSPVTVKA
ncbi:hypothetical protein NRB16_24555 [Pseudomonas sp. LJDD11]|uniref:hypothetical protein n=1 Tax=Pseudomonas sp. LJDD11 TaxID=2931984 RepID=UPI00211BC0E9|nr:hypothetical protein [Pseudomonas sp. LJDD11]MCQ9426696.1 hypothetical protein [Pseudomonas sp. LJDD11]